jgi:hypothetical protein
MTVEEFIKCNPPKFGFCIKIIIAFSLGIFRSIPAIKGQPFSGCPFLVWQEYRFPAQTHLLFFG